MANKKITALLILGIFLLAVSSFTVIASDVYVANGVVFVSPLAGGITGGTLFLNVSNVTGVFNQLVNCTFYAKSAGKTANITQADLGTAGNNTNKNVNISFDSTHGVLEDGNDYIFNATCRNLTNDVTDRTITGVIINNGVPTAPTLSPATNTLITTTTAQTFTGTVVDANTTSCTYAIGRGGVSTISGDTTTGTATYSSTTCTFSKTFSNQGDNGNWYWTITASDESNTSTSTGILQVNIPPVGGGKTQAQQQLAITGTEGEKSYLPLIVLGAVLALALILIYASKKK